MGSARAAVALKCDGGAAARLPFTVETHTLVMRVAGERMGICRIARWVRHRQGLRNMATPETERRNGSAHTAERPATDRATAEREEIAIGVQRQFDP